jgi:hypothetical protein
MDKEEGNGRGGKIKREREKGTYYGHSCFWYTVRSRFVKRITKGAPASPIKLLLELKIKPFHW